MLERVYNNERKDHHRNHYGLLTLSFLINIHPRLQLILPRAVTAAREATFIKIPSNKRPKSFLLPPSSQIHILKLIHTDICIYKRLSGGGNDKIILRKVSRGVASSLSRETRYIRNLSFFFFFCFVASFASISIFFHRYLFLPFLSFLSLFSNSLTL